MRRTFKISSGFLQNINFGSGKNSFFTSLWNKPKTRDERVKEYVPEVIEESMEAQRAVLEESTSRDVIVELGHKVLREIENKSPTPSIAPNLNKILKEYGSKDIIAQRPLSYLLYPSSSSSGGQQAHELVANFADNFRGLIEEVERSGCSARLSMQLQDNQGENVEQKTDSASGEKSVSPSTEASDSKRSGPVIMATRDEHEPVDITLFVRVVTGMALANVQHGDWSNAVRCADLGIRHVVDKTRLGGLLGMKAGILVHQKKYEEAAECAVKAVEASGNIQGYIHGGFALRMLKHHEDAIKLLEQGREDHPMNTQIVEQLEVTQGEVKKLKDENARMITT